jgi:hypothetical protein
LPVAAWIQVSCCSLRLETPQYSSIQCYMSESSRQRESNPQNVTAGYWFQGVTSEDEKPALLTLNELNFLVNTSGTQM